jgi:hypothetical protein
MEVLYSSEFIWGSMRMSLITASDLNLACLMDDFRQVSAIIQAPGVPVNAANLIFCHTPLRLFTWGCVVDNGLRGFDVSHQINIFLRGLKKKVPVVGEMCICHQLVLPGHEFVCSKY